MPSLKKYADMRTTAAAYYADGLMSEHAFSEAITQINQAELDAITNLEAKRLDLRIQTLGSIRGFEDEFYYARIAQIDAETEKLREAGLAEIEIEAWKQQQIAELEEEIRIKKEESISNSNRLLSNQTKMSWCLWKTQWRTRCKPYFRHKLRIRCVEISLGECNAIRYCRNQQNYRKGAIR